jgi:hypothetical protein
MKARRKTEKLAAAREPMARRLAFDPTPAGLISEPFRDAFKGLWASLRKKHFAKGDLSCETCHAIETEARLIHAHEVYSFPNPETVRLERVAFLCTRCHDAIHFERSRNHCQAPYLQTLTNHYCEVNGGLSEEDFQQDIADTFNKMVSLRKFYGGPSARPSMDYGPYRDAANQSLRRKKEWLADWLEDHDGDFEMLPDHECPWATAMWRD